jgi:hypothetical protein
MSPVLRTGCQLGISILIDFTDRSVWLHLLSGLYVWMDLLLARMAEVGMMSLVLGLFGDRIRQSWWNVVLKVIYDN